MKNGLMILLCGIMVLSLTACGNDEQEKSPSATKNDTQNVDNTTINDSKKDNIVTCEEFSPAGFKTNNYKELEFDESGKIISAKEYSILYLDESKNKTEAEYEEYYCNPGSDYGNDISCNVKIEKDKVIITGILDVEEAKSLNKTEIINIYEKKGYKCS